MDTRRYNKIELTRLSEQDSPNLVNFNCINEEEFGDLKSKRRKRIHELSLDMNQFLSTEALVEQLAGLNTTTLLYLDDSLAAYISLCADTITLADEEQEETKMPYATIPAIKVARLAIDKNFQKQGVGKFLLQYAIYRALEVRNNYCGVKFLTVDCFLHRVSYYENFGFQINVIQADGRQEHHPLSLRLDIDEYLEKEKIPSSQD